MKLHLSIRTRMGSGSRGEPEPAVWLPTMERSSIRENHVTSIRGGFLNKSPKHNNRPASKDFCFSKLDDFIMTKSDVNLKNRQRKVKVSQLADKGTVLIQSVVLDRWNRFILSGSGLNQNNQNSSLSPLLSF